ncbi:glycoside hydrolase family 9 protein [Belliella kenyensis]|uniref:Endoglucanase n=1 Tax=Belliella kenyensis TaxID=1472724 RepID=A0ABV8ERN5_9BACT|nr:glycoside hydrolase family 9 protein [Belliella kenyensis]MCH7403399.1 glycoside hydrolase family 9 protein [Belliella kenyensis]MDN3601611.1 glycoside hydrolase family 9 protein [Belliella kenyensis]
MQKFTLVTFLLFLTLILSCQNKHSEIKDQINLSIRVNQVGYLPEGQKVALISDEINTNSFHLIDLNTNSEVYTSEIGSAIKSPFSDKMLRKADFSAFHQEGEYSVYVEGLGYSPPFAIKKNVYEELGKASAKAFYFQRASTSMPEEYAGIWSRNLGHPDDKVYIHASAASGLRPEGTVISSPKGWYDAGDYNKYIVNSGITMGTLLSLLEDYPHLSASLSLDIPESGDNIPDLLNEILWNLEWMATMQDPTDGGVYHKLTTAAFEGMVLPEFATSKRYVVAKGTAATLDFAAVMAQASRVLKNFNAELASAYLEASIKAWKWAEANPKIFYRQDELNKKYEPAIQTGAYGDESLEDEWVWAASELFVSTQDEVYLKYINIPTNFNLPSWNKVNWLGYYTLLRFEQESPQLDLKLINAIKANLLEKASQYVKFYLENPYLTSMGSSIKDFVWGSNAVVSNQGIALLYAYRLTNDQNYLLAAQGNLNYILGINATGYSFVTGFGHHSPLRPHHRLAEAEPEKAPLPGFLAGGPNPGQQDGCDYPSDVPDESYVDDACSYASNEIAINWNAPFVYLVNVLNHISGYKQ